jgi:hypothetical protein
MPATPLQNLCEPEEEAPQPSRRETTPTHTPLLSVRHPQRGEILTGA